MPAVRGVQARQQHPFAAQQAGQRRVDPLAALIGQRDQHAPFVPGVGLPADQARGGQPVDPVRHGAGGDQGGAEQRARGELERRPMPAQRGEHVELPRLQAVVGERAAARDVQVPGEPGDPAQHLHRLDVQVGPLRPPRGDQVVHLVAQRWCPEDLAIGVRGISHRDGCVIPRENSIPPDPPGRSPRRRDAETGALAHY
jgi:hypothetical protein